MLDDIDTRLNRLMCETFFAIAVEPRVAAGIVYLAQTSSLQAASRLIDVEPPMEYIAETLAELAQVSETRDVRDVPVRADALLFIYTAVRIAFNAIEDGLADPERRADASAALQVCAGSLDHIEDMARWFGATRTTLNAMADASASERHRARWERDSTTTRRLKPKVGRNTPCPCGSSRKFKKCCG